MIRRIQFALLVMVIVAVGAYDVYLSIKHQNTLFEMEENPIGRWLIALDGGDVALFMTLKMIGISLVVWALMAMFRYRRHLAEGS